MLGLHRADSNCSKCSPRIRDVYTAYSAPLLIRCPVRVGLTISSPKCADAARTADGSLVTTVRGILRPIAEATCNWYGLNSACHIADGWLIHRASIASRPPISA